jgi:hypothetical protein
MPAKLLLGSHRLGAANAAPTAAATAAIAAVGITAAFVAATTPANAEAY